MLNSRYATRSGQKNNQPKANEHERPPSNRNCPRINFTAMSNITI